MRDFETCFEGTDDNLGIWNLEETVKIERVGGCGGAPRPLPLVLPGVL